MLLKKEIRMRHNKTVAAVLYRVPLSVTRVLLFPSGNSYPICPRCEYTIEREYMNFCDRCGQRLGWELFDNARVVCVSQVNIDSSKN